MWVRDKVDFYPARADTLDGVAREAAWSHLVEAMPFFLEYDKSTERTLPVIRLSPDSDRSPE